MRAARMAATALGTFRRVLHSNHGKFRRVSHSNDYKLSRISHSNDGKFSRISHFGVDVGNHGGKSRKCDGWEGSCRYVGYRDWETDRKSTRLNSSHRL